MFVIPENVKECFIKYGYHFDFEYIINFFSETNSTLIERNILYIFSAVNSDIIKSKTLKMLYLVVFYHLLDTAYYREFININNHNEDIENLIKKIIYGDEFKNDNNIIVLYLKQNLILGRKFYLKINLHIYMWNKLFISMQIKGRFLKIYRQIVKRRNNIVYSE
jgi:hypothetical protein